MQSTKTCQDTPTLMKVTLSSSGVYCKLSTYTPAKWGFTLRSTPTYHCKILKCADDCCRIINDRHNLNERDIRSPGKVTPALSAVYHKLSAHSPAGGASYSEARSHTTTVLKCVDHCRILKERQTLYEPDTHSPGILLSIST